MFVFQRLLCIVLFSVGLNACIESEEDLSDSPSPEAQAFKLQIANTQWKSDDTSRDDLLVTTYLSFLSDKQVSKRRVFRRSNNTIVEIAGNADYSIGKKVILPSGLTAFELNLTNKSISFDPDFIPPPIELELVIIKDDILYFGNPNIIETCEGEYFERETTNADVENGSIRDFDIRTECFARPTTINFDSPFRKVEAPKTTELQRFTEVLTDSLWQKSFLLDNRLNPNITTIQTHRFAFNPDGTFESTSHVTSRASVELPDNLSINIIDPITSIGQYTLGQSIITESGLTAISIDLDWQIDENDSDITLDIVYIVGTELYLGLPRKLPSCEGIEEPYYEVYDVAATEEPIDLDALDIDIIDIGELDELDEAYIGHIQGCYGRPNTLDFDKPYAHIQTMTLEQLDPSVFNSDDIVTAELDPLVIEPSEGEFTNGELDPETLEQDEGDTPTLELGSSIFNPPLGTYRI